MGDARGGPAGWRAMRAGPAAHCLREACGRAHGACLRRAICEKTYGVARDARGPEAHCLRKACGMARDARGPAARCGCAEQCCTSVLNSEPRPEHVRGGGIVNEAPHGYSKLVLHRAGVWTNVPEQYSRCPPKSKCCTTTVNRPASSTKANRHLTTMSGDVRRHVEKMGKHCPQLGRRSWPNLQDTETLCFEGSR